MAVIINQIRGLTKSSMKTWRVELSYGQETMGKVATERGMFLGNSLLPLFVMCNQIKGLMKSIMKT